MLRESDYAGDGGQQMREAEVERGKREREDKIAPREITGRDEEQGRGNRHARRHAGHAGHAHSGAGEVERVSLARKR